MLPADSGALTPLQRLLSTACSLRCTRDDYVSDSLDISDGLSQTWASAQPVAAARRCGLRPFPSQATLEDALFGGDDYELLIASDELPGTYPIGVLTAESGLSPDSAPLAPKGFDTLARSDRSALTPRHLTLPSVLWLTAEG